MLDISTYPSILPGAQLSQLPPQGHIFLLHLLHCHLSLLLCPLSLPGQGRYLLGFPLPVNYIYYLCSTFNALAWMISNLRLNQDWAGQCIRPGLNVATCCWGLRFPPLTFSYQLPSSASPSRSWPARPGLCPCGRMACCPSSGPPLLLLLHSRHWLNSWKLKILSFKSDIDIMSDTYILRSCRTSLPWIFYFCKIREQNYFSLEKPFNCT